ncbi:hypothetical protein Tco_0012311 [Tanacetum coccineum]
MGGARGRAYAIGEYTEGDVKPRRRRYRQKNKIATEKGQGVVRPLEAGYGVLVAREVGIVGVMRGDDLVVRSAGDGSEWRHGASCDDDDDEMKV